MKEERERENWKKKRETQESKTKGGHEGRERKRELKRKKTDQRK